MRGIQKLGSLKNRELPYGVLTDMSQNFVAEKFPTSVLRNRAATREAAHTFGFQRLLDFSEGNLTRSYAAAPENARLWYSTDEARKDSHERLPPTQHLDLRSNNKKNTQHSNFFKGNPLILRPPLNTNSQGWSEWRAGCPLLCLGVFLLSVLVASQFVDVLVLANLLMRLGLNLANALSGYSELLSDLFECMRHPINQPMAHLQNLALLRRKI